MDYTIDLATSTHTPFFQLSVVTNLPSLPNNNGPTGHAEHLKSDSNNQTSDCNRMQI